MVRPEETSVIRTLPLSEDRELRRRFMVLDEPMAGNFRFGLALELLDELAEETALAYVRSFHPDARVVTAAIDNIIIRRPADVTRDMTFRARINHVGRTSLEVGIRVEQDTAHLASCYFTMVARSLEREQGLVLPPMEYGDELEIRRHDRAIERRRKETQRQQTLLQPPAAQEFEMLLALHSEQESADFMGHLARDLTTSSWERVYPEQENVPNKIFGGHLIHRAYQLASIHAEELATDRPVVVAVNRINFLRPVRIGDKLHFASRIVYTGRTSIAVGIRIERVGRSRNVRDLTNDCVFTFVNVDGGLCPRTVPPVYPTTYDEDARYMAAHRRRCEYLEWKESRRASLIAEDTGGS